MQVQVLLSALIIISRMCSIALPADFFAALSSFFVSYSSDSWWIAAHLVFADFSNYLKFSSGISAEVCQRAALVDHARYQDLLTAVRFRVPCNANQDPDCRFSQFARAVFHGSDLTTGLFILFAE